jgi:hypothetical protein
MKSTKVGTPAISIKIIFPPNSIGSFGRILIDSHGLPPKVHNVFVEGRNHGEL